MQKCIDHKCNGEHMIGWERSNDQAEHRTNTSHGIALSEKTVTNVEIARQRESARSKEQPERNSRSVIMCKINNQ